MQDGIAQTSHCPRTDQTSHCRKSSFESQCLVNISNGCSGCASSGCGPRLGSHPKDQSVKFGHQKWTHSSQSIQCNYAKTIEGFAKAQAGRWRILKSKEFNGVIHQGRNQKRVNQVLLGRFQNRNGIFFDNSLQNIGPCHCQHSVHGDPNKGS